VELFVLVNQEKLLLPVRKVNLCTLVTKQDNHQESDLRQYIAKSVHASG